MITCYTPGCRRKYTFLCVITINEYKNEYYLLTFYRDI